MPSDLTVAATSAAGAAVIYTASASDAVDPAPATTCSQPSGSVFPIGTTLVNCTATDASGNSATGTFSVRVTGAAGQIVALVDKTLAYLDLPPLEATLKTRLESAATTALAANNKPAACAGLALYAGAIKLAPPSVLTAAQKADLLADANRIKSVLACS